MRLLLDTHVWLWLQISPERLGSILELVEDTDNELFLSAASSWEIAIKWSSGKLQLPAPPQDYIPDRMAHGGVRGLAVQHAHVVAVASLPMHHQDPFDRILLVQAAAEHARLVTADDALLAYGVDILHF